MLSIFFLSCLMLEHSISTLKNLHSDEMNIFILLCLCVIRLFGAVLCVIFIIAVFFRVFGIIMCFFVGLLACFVRFRFLVSFVIVIFGFSSYIIIIFVSFILSIGLSLLFCSVSLNIVCGLHLFFVILASVSIILTSQSSISQLFSSKTVLLTILFISLTSFFTLFFAASPLIFELS